MLLRQPQNVNPHDKLLLAKGKEYAIKADKLFKMALLLTLN